MEQNNVQERKKDSNNPKLKLIVSILIAVILFIADLYVMLNQPDNLLILAAITILILIAVYTIADSVLKISEEQKAKQEEQYENVFRSEKAAYLLMKKSFDDLSVMIGHMKNDDEKDSCEEIINAQKAVAKILINRSKENADAIINSNHTIFTNIIELEQKIDQSQQEIIHYQQNFSESFNNEVIGKQDRLFIELNNIEASINNTLLELSEKVSGFQEEIERLADHIEMLNSETIHELTKNVADIREMASAGEKTAVPQKNVKETEKSEERIVVEKPMMEESAPEKIVEEPIIEESVPEEIAEEPVIETIPQPDLSNPNKMMTPEEIEALIAGTLGNTGSESDTEPQEETVKEEIVEEEPAIEPVPAPKPDLSDPNKMMTPEDIEALIAGTLGDIGLDLNNLDVDPELPGTNELEGAGIEETIAEEPTAEEKKAEEKPPMPDLSNPNKIMTPEEIAALIANM